MNLRKWTLGMFVCMTLFLGSCALMGSLFEDKVVTTSDNVVAEHVETAIPITQEGVVPKEVLDRLREEGKTVVIVDKNHVKDPSKSVEIQDPDAGNLLDIGLGIANTIWPGMALLEGAGLLFSRRKRQHYGDAVKAITPYDGDVAVKEAIVSLARGLGLAHSSEGTKTEFSKERSVV